MSDKDKSDEVKINIEIGSKTFIKVVIALVIVLGLLAGNRIIINMVGHFLGIKNFPVQQKRYNTPVSEGKGHGGEEQVQKKK